MRERIPYSGVPVEVEIRASHDAGLWWITATYQNGSHAYRGEESLHEAFERATKYFDVPADDIRWRPQDIRIRRAYNRTK